MKKFYFNFCLHLKKIDEGVYKICSALALKRSDKKSDRVEISPEQLSKATSHVEVYFNVSNVILQIKL